MAATVSHIHALPAGYEFEGYRIDCVLGSGGFGITYKADETLIRRSVAIKEYCRARSRRARSIPPPYARSAKATPSFSAGG